MSQSANIQPGNYIISNTVSKTVLDVANSKAIGNPYNMSPSQTWTLMPNGAFWTIQNAMTKRYLGLGVEDQMADGCDIREVDHAFLWRLEFAGDYTKAFVPYSKLLLDLYGAGRSPGTTVHVYEGDGVDHNRRWIFSTPPVLPLEEGGIYSIINLSSRTALAFDNEDKACGFRQKAECPSQQFQVTNTGTGWAFQNIQSKLYLGLSPSIIIIAQGTPVRAVNHPFSWIVLPASVIEENQAFKLFVPYTEKLADLDMGRKEDGTKVNLYGNHNADKTWLMWTFQKCRAREGHGPVPGEPDIRSY